MFYQTKVKSIFPGGIIDAHNKRLVFAGNKRVNVGDLVWTDGSVVLGHTPIRGGGAFFDSSIAGVPVIGNGFEGYFDLNGNFHSANLPVSSSRFVNDDKYYYQIPSGISFSDAEIYTGSGDKTIGYIYARRSNNAIEVYTNNQTKLTEYNFSDVAHSIYFLDKNADVYGFSSKNFYNSEVVYKAKGGDINIPEVVPPPLLPMVESLINWDTALFLYVILQYSFFEVTKTESESWKWFCRNGNIEVELYHSREVTSSYTAFTLIDDDPREPFVKALAESLKEPRTVDANRDTFFPLQDGFKLYCNGTYKIFSPNGSVIDIPFLSGDGTNPANIPIVQLSNGRYLFSCSKGMYLYDQQYGLKQVLNKPCFNRRLRKMKNVLHAKVIS